MYRFLKSKSHSTYISRKLALRNSSLNVVDNYNRITVAIRSDEKRLIEKFGINDVIDYCDFDDMEVDGDFQSSGKSKNRCKNPTA